MKPLVHPSIEDVTLPGLFYALGDPARLSIVKSLYQAKTHLTCQQAVDGIENLPVSTRSHCFRILREAGVIRTEKQGRECYNSLRLDELNNKFPNVLQTILKAC